MSERETLGYSFAPVPAWLFADVEAGLLSYRDFVLLAYLYERAETSRLRYRQMTPKLALETIIRAVRWTEEPASLARHLRRLRDAGRWFEYSTEGNSRTRILYAFTLYPDGPRELSDHRPPVPAQSRPPVPTVEAEPESQTRADAAAPVSARREGAPAEECPPVGSPCPPVAEASEPVPERVSADVADAACPPALDVPEKTTTRSEERLHGEGSPSRARAREDEQAPWRALASRAARDDVLASFEPGDERDFLVELIEMFDAVEVPGP